MVRKSHGLGASVLYDHTEFQCNLMLVLVAANQFKYTNRAEQKV